MPCGVTLIHDDAIHLARWVHDRSADLVYMDPPFNVGTVFRARNKLVGSSWRAKGALAYDDRWPSIDEYLLWLSPRLEVAWCTLHEEGTLWLHLDHRAVHDAKVLCDRLFGRSAFRAEVIWTPGNGSRNRNFLGITHQTILVYARGKQPIFHGRDPVMREPFAATSLAMHFTQRDAHGRLFRERIIGGKRYRYYADEGRALGSVWSDCPSMEANTPLLNETTGYATQKPLKLLTRIVRAASRKGGLIVDPFCGSGTTLMAAVRDERQSLGMDIGALAIATSRTRFQHESIEIALQNT